MARFGAAYESKMNRDHSKRDTTFDMSIPCLAMTTVGMMVVK